MSGIVGFTDEQIAYVENRVPVLIAEDIRFKALLDIVEDGMILFGMQSITDNQKRNSLSLALHRVYGDEYYDLGVAEDERSLFSGFFAARLWSALQSSPGRKAQYEVWLIQANQKASAALGRQLDSLLDAMYEDEGVDSMFVQASDDAERDYDPRIDDDPYYDEPIYGVADPVDLPEVGEVTELPYGVELSLLSPYMRGVFQRGQVEVANEVSAIIDKDEEIDDLAASFLARIKSKGVRTFRTPEDDLPKRRIDRSRDRKPNRVVRQSFNRHARRQLIGDCP